MEATYSSKTSVKFLQAMPHHVLVEGYTVSHWESRTFRLLPATSFESVTLGYSHFAWTYQ
jgi:hypothetical protein